MLPHEIILVDDASTDNTFILLNELSDKNEVKVSVISLESNSGVASARNVGLLAANQPYVAFLDADDAWHPKKLQIQYEIMSQNKNIVISGHNSSQKNADQPTRLVDWPNINHNPQINTISKCNALLSNPFITSTVMMKREPIFRFKEQKRFSEDYLLWLQLILHPLTAIHISSSLASSFKASFGESGLSANLWQMEIGELSTYKQIYRENKINLAIFLFLVIYSFAKFLRRVIITRKRLSFRKL